MFPYFFPSPVILYQRFYLVLFFPGEVLGFENLVFSIFEFVHTLLENNKFKSTVRKALPELIYYIILYMQITEDQVRNHRHVILPDPVRNHFVLTERRFLWLGQSLDGKPSAVCRGWGWWHFLLLCPDLCSGPTAGELHLKQRACGQRWSAAVQPVHRNKFYSDYGQKIDVYCISLDFCFFT